MVWILTVEGKPAQDKKYIYLYTLENDRGTHGQPAHPSRSSRVIKREPSSANRQEKAKYTGYNAAVVQSQLFGEGNLLPSRRVHVVIVSQKEKKKRERKKINEKRGRALPKKEGREQLGHVRWPHAT